MSHGPQVERVRVRYSLAVLHVITGIVALCWGVYDYLHAVYGVPPSTLVWFLFAGAAILLVSSVLNLTSSSRSVGWFAVAGSAALLVYFVPANVEAVKGFLRPMSIVSAIDLAAAIGAATLTMFSLAGALSRALQPVP